MINYIEGDITKPVNSNPKIIPHICNTFGRWGAGVVIPIRRKWPLAEQVYRNDKQWKLGTVQFISVENNVMIANMIAQPYLISPGQITIDARYNIQSFDYNSLEKCLEQVVNYARPKNMEIHMPMIGTGLAKGDWSKIEPIIEKTMKDLKVYVYEYKK